MKKCIFILIISVICSHFIGANNVTKTMAVREVKNFLKKKNETSASDNTIRQTPFDSIVASIDSSFVRNYSISGVANMYLVCFDSGWILLSTETAVKPILAYSLSEDFHIDEELPDGLKWLFSYYENVIAYARDSLTIQINAWDNNITDNLTNREESVYLSALGEVQWGQSSNNSLESDCNRAYNKYCPDFHSVYCSRTLVGCGAVALGQVLWYYKWPHYGFIPKEMLNDNGSVSEYEEFKYYYWDLMPTKILSTTSMEEINMIAGFLRDCGFAEHMQYGSNVSNTYLSSIKTALEYSFAYENVQMLYRPNTTNWINRMKDEIRNGRPVIYRGTGPSNGHFFILHGFSGDYFNINWGWCGSSNGTMCTLDALNVNGTNYNTGHYALVNIAPTRPHCTPLTILSNIVLSDNFVVQNGGGISICNQTVTNEQQGVIYSGDYVRLDTGFHIQAGAKVHIAIRDMGCLNIAKEDTPDTPSEMIRKSKENIDDEIIVNAICVTPNPVHDILTIKTSKPAETLVIYNHTLTI